MPPIAPAPTRSGAPWHPSPVERRGHLLGRSKRPCRPPPCQNRKGRRAFPAHGTHRKHRILGPGKGAAAPPSLAPECSRTGKTPVLTDYVALRVARCTKRIYKSNGVGPVYTLRSCPPAALGAAGGGEDPGRELSQSGLWLVRRVKAASLFPSREKRLSAASPQP